MGEIRIPVDGQETTYWSDYMGQKFEAVIRDWIERVEVGDFAFWHGTHDVISTEHLRIAKAFLNRIPADVVDPLVIPLQDQEDQAHVD